MKIKAFIMHAHNTLRRLVIANIKQDYSKAESPPCYSYSCSVFHAFCYKARQKGGLKLSYYQTASGRVKPPSFCQVLVTCIGLLHQINVFHEIYKLISGPCLTLRDN